jgi:hypothetical protein
MRVSGVINREMHRRSCGFEILVSGFPMSTAYLSATKKHLCIYPIYANIVPLNKKGLSAKKSFLITRNFPP